MKSGAAECGRRGGRLRAITFDIRNYSSAECAARPARAFRASPRGRTKRSRVASAAPPPPPPADSATTIRHAHYFNTTH